MPKAYLQQFVNKFIWGERATNLENPQTSINGWTLQEIFGGPPAISGEQVDEGNSLTFSAVWRATAIISGIISSLPFKIYRQTATGREEARSHPYWEIFTKMPTQIFTKPVYFERALHHYLNWGNHFAKIRFGKNARLELIHPATLKGVDRNTRGNLVYTFLEDSIDGAQEYQLRQDQIIHVPNMGDQLIGKGVITNARETIGLEFARRRYGNLYFKDGGKPKAFISTDSVLKPEQRKEIADWIRREKQKGSDIMLDSGFKYQSMTIPPEDAQFLGTGEFNVEEVARWYGVPKSKLASSKDPTHTNIENMAIEFLQDTIAPILSKFETEYTSKMLSDPNYAEFDMDAYLRADTMAQAESYRTGIMNGYMTINEVRKKKNLNPVEGGDEPLVQGAMIKLKSLDQNNGNQENMGGDQGTPEGEQ